jgi:multimeric flavodoxin WrbA
MKIVACVGSSRRNGNTSRMIGLIAESLAKEAADHQESLTFETIYLGHQEIGMCRGCRICFDKGEEKCPLKDDLLAIKEKIRTADGLILASPVYVNDVSGITKNWIDRLAHVCHRPEFAGKCAYVIATVGDGPTKHALKTMTMALNFWGVYTVGKAGFKTGALMKQDKLEALFQKEAASIAKKLFHAIHSRQFNKPSFLSLLTFKIQQRYWQRNGINSIDYLYWKKQGWVKPEREYYLDHEANPAKVALARIAGSLMAPFVT